MFRLSALTAGILFDWIFGEPSVLVHPVILMGKLISHTESQLRRLRPGREKSSGYLLVLLVIFCSVAVPGLILLAVSRLEKGQGPITWCLTAFWSFQLLAAKSLYQESGKVRKALEASDREQARQCVSMIVGRDTEHLDEAGIARAAVETVAENASDGVIAPLLFIALFGILGGFFYKAVNTMDSMVGYKNERYLFFGRAAARLDDLCNFLPARITGCLLTAAAWILGMLDPSYDGKNAWRIYRRDRRNHASPNSAHGEAACAGALHVRLAGDAWYFGKLYKKPYIGDDDRPIEAEDIRRAGRLMAAAELLGLLLCWMIYLEMAV
ncbi:MAG: adenosylcobinamide-phosphate synthase CbiB [Lachnospiraceae bacterium]|nr:adenosylcobinamide-phosphate synthase CbiB [Lachnospiraceae bacterium]